MKDYLLKNIFIIQYSKIFQDILNQKYKNIVVTLLENHIEIITTFEEEFTPSDWSHYKNVLKEETKYLYIKILLDK